MAGAPQKSLGPIYTVPSEVVSLFFSHLGPIDQRRFGTSCKRLHAGYLAASPIALAFNQLFSSLKRPVKSLINVAAGKIEEMEKRGRTNSKRLEQATMRATNKLLICYIHRLHKINVQPYSAHFHAYARVPQCMITLFARRKFAKRKLKGDAFIPQIRQSFNLKAYHSFLGTYARFPIEKITIENFKEYVGKTHDFYDQIPVHHIEAALRNQIIDLHKPEDIDRMSEEFTHLSEEDPRFINAKAALELELNSEKNDLQAQLDKVKSQLDALKVKERTSDPEKKQAKAALAQAYSELITVFKTLTTDEVDVKDKASNVKRIRYFLCETTFLELVTTGINGNCEDYLQGLEKLEDSYIDYLKKKTIYEHFPSPPTRKQLRKTSAEIAQYVPGTTILKGGKLFEIEQQLQPDALAAAVWDKMATIAGFYKELNIPVDRGRTISVVGRSRALHQIID